MTRAVETLVLAESDTRHPLLSLLNLKEDAGGLTGATQTSTRQEWALEARKLELQGKQEQARSIREAFFRFKPTPWQPWSEAAIRALEPRALDAKDPSAKLKKTLTEYGLWHSQPKFIEDLAQRANFHAATALSIRGFVVNHGSHLPYLNSRETENPVAKAMKALSDRLLRPYSERAFNPSYS